MAVTPQDVINSGKVSWIDNSVGAGLLRDFRANVQHPYDRVFVQNDANLAGKSVTLFQTPINGTYTPLNATGTVTKTLSDTNWDQANQAQYSYLLTGMYFGLYTQTQQSFLASPNDLSTWADYCRVMLEDMTVQIVAEDNTLMRQKASHIPQGNGLTGVVGVTGTNASPISQPVVTSGVPAAANVFSFGQSSIWVPKASRFNVVVTFGPSALAASAAYKPTSPVIAVEARFSAMKFQSVV